MLGLVYLKFIILDKSFPHAQQAKHDRILKISATWTIFLTSLVVLHVDLRIVTTSESFATFLTSNHNLSQLVLQQHEHLAWQSYQPQCELVPPSLPLCLEKPVEMAWPTLSSGGQSLAESGPLIWCLVLVPAWACRTAASRPPSQLSAAPQGWSSLSPGPVRV